MGNASCAPGRGSADVYQDARMRRRCLTVPDGGGPEQDTDAVPRSTTGLCDAGVSPE
jgi:hypothetical protein